MIEISHPQARHLIRQGLDGRRLPDEQWASLQLHLENCAECRVYRGQIAEIERGLQRALRSALDGARRAAGIGAAREVTRDVLQFRAARKKTRKAAAFSVLAAVGVICLLLVRGYRLASAPQPTPTQAPTPFGAVASVTPVRYTFRGVAVFSGPSQAPGGEGTRDIYLLNPGSGPESAELVNLTQNAYDELHPAWSPDGEWVAFLSDRPSSPGAPKKYEVYVMHVAGSQLTRLTLEPGVDWQGPLSWSMDGRWLALTGRYGGGADASYVYLVPISVDPLSPAGARRLGASRGALGPARFSPGALMLAFGASEAPLQGIQVYDLVTGAFIPVTWDDTQTQSLKAGVGGQFDWSFDGSLLAYLADGRYHPFTGGLVENGARTLIKTSMSLARAETRYYGSQTNAELETLAGTGIVRGLTTVPAAPDPQAVVYLRDDSGSGCWTVHLRRQLQGMVDTLAVPGLCVQGGLSRESWKLDERSGGRPWLLVLASRDGESLPAVYGLQLPSERVAGDLLVERLAELPFTPQVDEALPVLRARPDGAPGLGIRPGPEAAARSLPAPSIPGALAGQLAFSVKHGAHSQVMAAAPDGSRLRGLSQADTLNTCAAWSPDRSVMAYLSDFNTRAEGVNEVYSMDANGLHVRRLTQPTFEVFPADGSPYSQPTPRYECPVWSPDGERLAAVVHTGGGDYLALVPAAGGEADYVAIQDASLSAGPAWSADGKSVAYATRSGSLPGDILLLDVASVATGTARFTRLVRGSGSDMIFALAFSGSDLVYITQVAGALNGAIFSLHWTAPDGSEPRPAAQLPGTDLPAVFGRDHLSVLPDGRLGVFLNSRLEDKVKTLLFLYDPAAGRVEQILNLEDTVYDAAWSGDGRWVIYAAESGLYAADFPAAAAGTAAPALLYEGRAFQVDWK